MERIEGDVHEMINELWPGGPYFKQEPGTFRYGTDSVLLAYFANTSRIRRRRHAVDLGCGTGIISILLAWHVPDLHVDGVEVISHVARLATENTKLCKLDERITIYEADLRRHRMLLSAGAYDFTISNPPYYKFGSGKRASDAYIAAARGEELCTLDDVCRAAGYLTRWGGSFFLVQKPERLTGVFRSLSASGFEPKRIRFVHYKQLLPPNLVLIESRRGGNPSLKIEAPLVLANDDGTDSEEVKLIYQRD